MSSEKIFFPSFWRILFVIVFRGREELVYPSHFKESEVLHRFFKTSEQASAIDIIIPILQMRNWDIWDLSYFARKTIEIALLSLTLSAMFFPINYWYLTTNSLWVTSQTKGLSCKTRMKHVLSVHEAPHPHGQDSFYLFSYPHPPYRANLYFWSGKLLNNS